MEVHVVEVDWATYADRLRRIRTVVFVHEQKVPEQEEWDGLDDDANHFLALDSAGRDVGCARLLPTGQIGRMAVLAHERGKGIGELLLAAAVAKAESRNMREVFLHAQTHAIGFYQRGGFVSFGDEYLEAGIPHRSMRRLLAIAAPELQGRRTTIIQSPSADVTAPPPMQHQVDLFSGEAQARDALVKGLAAARRELIIFSHLLDPLYFDHETTASVISAFTRRAANTRTRILILALSRRLSSKCSIRILDKDYDAPESCHVAWDQSGYWLLPDWREPQGSLHLNAVVAARRFFQDFEVLWAHSHDDPELRELRI
jgi:predicted GNAT family N-acyltransferase